MRMSHDSYVYFCLAGDDFDPDIITQRIGIQPTSTCKKGTSYGKKGGVLKNSGWDLMSTIIDNLEVSRLANDLVDQLFDKIDIINELKSELHLTSIIRFVPFVDVNEFVSFPILGHDFKVIEFAYKTHTDIKIDGYTFDPSDPKYKNRPIG